VTTRSSISNGLARPADYSHYSDYFNMTRLQTSLCWHRNGLVRTDNVLAYGHREASAARVHVGTGQAPGGTR